MDNIEELLRALTDEDDSSDTEQEHNSDESGGLFGDLDPNMLLTIMSLFESMNKQDDSEKLLLALKPLLREENRAKIDTAVKFMKLFSLLPLIKDSGMLGRLL
ncbi:MAG: hypothetical protein IJZ47_11110 [Oscillospiraceae bacterium]|nr:hypothetical protein [Oscillospiraceae bacterium]